MKNETFTEFMENSRVAIECNRVYGNGKLIKMKLSQRAEEVFFDYRYQLEQGFCEFEYNHGREPNAKELAQIERDALEFVQIMWEDQ